MQPHDAALMAAWHQELERGTTNLRDAFETFAAGYRAPRLAIEPIGYVVQMDDGPFVGIWRNRADADHVCSKQPPTHRDKVLPVYAKPAVDVEAFVTKLRAHSFGVKDGWLRTHEAEAVLREALNG